MSQRLSRKEIKRDEFMETLGDAFDYVRGHTRSLLGAAGIVAVAAILVAVYFGFQQRRERDADEALSLALNVFQAAIDPVAADPENPISPTFVDAAARTQRARELFGNVREEYPRSDAAGIATAYLGQMAAADGNTTEARAFWQEVVAEGADHMLATEAAVNLMALDRAEGKGDDLVTRLRAMLSGTGEGLPPDLLWHQLAVTLEFLGRDDEATAAYRRLAEEYPRSTYAAEARQRSGGDQLPPFGP